MLLDNATTNETLRPATNCKSVCTPVECRRWRKTHLSEAYMLTVSASYMYHESVMTKNLSGQSTDIISTTKLKEARRSVV